MQKCIEKPELTVKDTERTSPVSYLDRSPVGASQGASESALAKGHLFGFYETKILMIYINIVLWSKYTSP